MLRSRGSGFDGPGIGPAAGAGRCAATSDSTDRRTPAAARNTWTRDRISGIPWPIAVRDGKLWAGMASWEGRVALVSGASAGIGAATAVALGAKGCAVTLMARRRDRLEDVAGRVRAAGGRAHVVAGDVTTDDDVARAIDQTVAVFGSLDIVVANAGAGYHGSLLDTSP